MWNAASLAVFEEQGTNLHFIIVYTGDQGEGEKKDYVLPPPVDIKAIAIAGVAERNARQSAVKMPLGAIDLTAAKAVPPTPQQQWKIDLFTLERLQQVQASVGVGSVQALDNAVAAQLKVVTTAPVDDSYVALL